MASGPSVDGDGMDDGSERAFRQVVEKSVLAVEVAANERARVAQQEFARTEVALQRWGKTIEDANAAVKRIGEAGGRVRLVEAIQWVLERGGRFTTVPAPGIVAALVIPWAGTCPPLKFAGEIGFGFTDRCSKPIALFLGGPLGPGGEAIDGPFVPPHPVVYMTKIVCMGTAHDEFTRVVKAGALGVAIALVATVLETPIVPGQELEHTIDRFTRLVRCGCGTVFPIPAGSLTSRVKGLTLCPAHKGTWETKGITGIFDASLTAPERITSVAGWDGPTCTLCAMPAPDDAAAWIGHRTWTRRKRLCKECGDVAVVCALCATLGSHKGVTDRGPVLYMMHPLFPTAPGTSVYNVAAIKAGDFICGKCKTSRGWYYCENNCFTVGPYELLRTPVPGAGYTGTLCSEKCAMEYAIRGGFMPDGAEAAALPVHRHHPEEAEQIARDDDEADDNDPD